MAYEKNSAKPEVSDRFRAGFVVGWMQAVESQEPDKVKLKKIAEAAADEYIKSAKA